MKNPNFTPTTGLENFNYSGQNLIRGFWLNSELTNMSAEEIWKRHFGFNKDKEQSQADKKNRSKSVKIDKEETKSNNQKEKTKPRKKEKKDSDDHKPKPVIKKHIIEDPKKSGNDIPIISKR